ncbi:MAG: glycosyltransferase [Actinobacteria bacterium]|uniref:Unannotated protein n=1 Tax=freshwater metagenome TaxID=449393 RepID=A0A6J7KH20_9ZZZZ|nr:glycosyltransferase [Actinomycetota bacterium]
MIAENSRAFLSVVIPSLNQGRFIEGALDSVLAQESDAIAVEVLVVDGRSRDSTREIVSTRAESDNRIALLDASGAGPAAAINQGLAASEGEYIAWLSADDRYASGAIARAVTHLREHASALLVYGQADIIDESGVVTGTYPTLPPGELFNSWHGGCGISQPTVLMRRSVLEDLGYLDENLRTCFDFEYWLRLGAVGAQRVGFIDALQAFVTDQPERITRTLRCTVALESIEVLHRHGFRTDQHWLKTALIDEASAYPQALTKTALVERINFLRSAAATYLQRVEAEEFREWSELYLSAKAPVDGVWLSRDLDGWFDGDLEIRWSKRAEGSALLLLFDCAYLRPPIKVRISTGGKASQDLTIDKVPFGVHLVLDSQNGSRATLGVTQARPPLVEMLTETRAISLHLANARFTRRRRFASALTRSGQYARLKAGS